MLNKAKQKMLEGRRYQYPRWGCYQNQQDVVGSEGDNRNRCQGFEDRFAPHQAPTPYHEERDSEQGQGCGDAHPHQIFVASPFQVKKARQ